MSSARRMSFAPRCRPCVRAVAAMSFSSGRSPVAEPTPVSRCISRASGRSSDWRLHFAGSYVPQSGSRSSSPGSSTRRCRAASPVLRTGSPWLSPSHLTTWPPRWHSSSRSPHGYRSTTSSCVLPCRSSSVDENIEPLDLVVRGGRVVDPGQNVDDVLDVGVRYGRIAVLGKDLSQLVAPTRLEYPPDLGTTVIDARGKLVVPGLVDLHAHVYTGVCPLTVAADEACLSSGVTTVASAGDAGAN